MRRASRVLVIVALLPGPLAAQRERLPWVRHTITLGSDFEDRLRLRQLSGDTSTAGFLLRSLSSLSPRLNNDTTPTGRLQWGIVLPDIRYARNSNLPFSLNDGARWAGRGKNVGVLAGARVEWGPLRVFVVPEFAYAQNDSFALTGPPVNPAPPASRNPFSSPWHAGPQSADVPLRFGNRPFQQTSFGQSTVMVEARGVSVGASSENEWWGPGVRNALILSNNAQGFPHGFLRTAHPVRTRIGDFEGRWITGWLRESPYFDFDPSNDLRSITLLALTWSPDSNMTFGAARSVTSPISRRVHALTNAFQVFADVGQPNARPMVDSAFAPGRDQLLSLFFRWTMPKDGLEAYGEWGRAEFPVSLRDFFIHPNHTQAYTLGLQWLGEPWPWLWSGRPRAQFEASFLEQSPTYRYRPIGSWYASRAVVQGHTNRGQPLGAAIGPGSSSQWIALDYVSQSWQTGAFFNRIRWLEDAHSQKTYPPDPNLSFGWCDHDVSLLTGLRGSIRSRFGTMSAEYSTGWRLTVFFDYPGPCPIGQGRDVRNHSLTLSFTP